MNFINYVKEEGLKQVDFSFGNIAWSLTFVRPVGRGVTTFVSGDITLTISLERAPEENKEAPEVSCPDNGPHLFLVKYAWGEITLAAERENSLLSKEVSNGIVTFQGATLIYSQE